MWTKERLQEKLKEKLADYQFIIASNREPYVHEHKGKKIKWVKAISGLTIAMDPVMQVVGGTWVAYGSGDADKGVVDENNRIKVPPYNPAYTLKRVWLNKEEENGYYYGYSNCALWPMAHIAYQKPVFNISDWEYYKKVNNYFAQSIMEEMKGEKSFIWLQDYHLTLCGKYIKEKFPEAIVSLFWHIPWPNPEVFRICPQRKEILEGLLSCDLLGFHLRYHCHNFLYAAEQELEAKVNWEEMSVTYQGHKTLIRAFPISVDFETINQKVSSPIADKTVEELPLQRGPYYEILALGVDRIDYTKGIIERIKAVDRFLEKNPQYQGKFLYLQIGALSRMHIKSYKRLFEDIQSLIEEINWKYRSGNWYPILFTSERLDYLTHLAYYRTADLMLVSSLHDGMNLVAKEFVSAQVDLKGVLILSPFTGAARELKEAISVNPYDTETFADAIKEGIELSSEDKKNRMQSMRDLIKENNIYKWTGDFISELVKL